MDLETSGLSDDDFQIEKLRTSRFLYTRWTAQDIHRFAQNHQVLKNLELEKFQLSDSHIIDWVGLIAELAGFANLDVAFGTASFYSGNRPLPVYNEASNLRLQCNYILRRRSGFDYRTINNVVSVRNQRGGVSGEDVVLDYW